MNITLRNGNIIDELKKIPNESVDCVVSSPPYYGLRDYSGVASYASEDYDELLRIANTDLQKHRDLVLETQKDRYYLTEPAFNEKDKEWNSSLKYDTSGVWGGYPECEHEWGVHKPSVDVTGFQRNRNGLNKYAEIIDGHQRTTTIAPAPIDKTSKTCLKCGAWKGQLGLEPSYQMYIDHLMLVMKELKRVLKKTGTLFWNMGDSYAGNMGSRAGWQDSKYSESREEGINNGEAVFLKADYGNIRTKSLMMIPERFAMAMIDDGWILRNKIVWYKRNGMPSSVKDRLSNKWEYVFFFTKAKKYCFNLDGIRKPLAESSIKRISQKNIPNQFKSGKSLEFAETNPVNNIPKILNNMHKKYDGVYGKLTSEESEKYGSPRARNMRTNTERSNEVPHHPKGDPIIHGMRLPPQADQAGAFNPNGANPGDVLFDETLYELYTDPSIQDAFIEYLERERPELLMPSILDIPTMSHKFAHFAVFPETLVEPLIKAGCPPDGVVLDPFAGSGTVGVVAMKQHKNAILIEISPEYCNIIKKRLNWGAGLDVEYEEFPKEIVK